MAAGADPKIENNDYEDDDENEEEKDKDEMDTTDEHVHGRTAEAFAMDNNKVPGVWGSGLSLFDVH